MTPHIFGPGGNKLCSNVRIRSKDWDKTKDTDYCPRITIPVSVELGSPSYSQGRPLTAHGKTGGGGVKRRFDP